MENIQTVPRGKPRIVSIPGEDSTALVGSLEDGAKPIAAKGAVCAEPQDGSTPLGGSLAELAAAKWGEMGHSGGDVVLGQDCAPLEITNPEGMTEGSGTETANLGAVAEGVALAGAALFLAATIDRGEAWGRRDFFFKKPGFEGGFWKELKLFFQKRGQHGGEEAGRNLAGKEAAGLKIEEGDPPVLEEAQVVAVKIGMEDTLVCEIPDGLEEAVAGGGIEGAPFGKGCGEKDGEGGTEGAALAGLGENAGNEEAEGGGAGEVLRFAARGRGPKGIAQADAKEGEEVLLGKEDTLRSGDAEDTAEDPLGDDLGFFGDVPAEKAGMDVRLVGLLPLLGFHGL